MDPNGLFANFNTDDRDCLRFGPESTGIADVNFFICKDDLLLGSINFNVFFLVFLERFCFYFRKSISLSFKNYSIVPNSERLMGLPLLSWRTCMVGFSTIAALTQ